MDDHDEAEVEDGALVVFDNLLQQIDVEPGHVGPFRIMYRQFQNLIHGRVNLNQGVRNILQGLFRNRRRVGAVLAAGVGELALPGLGGALFGVAGDAVEALSRNLRKWLQGLVNDPEALQLERAYGFLRIRNTATIREVHRAWRRASLECHPDRQDGSHELMCECNIHYTAILRARGLL